MQIRVYHGNVPGVVSLQVIRGGMQAGKVSLPCAHWYSGARTLFCLLWDVTSRYFFLEPSGAPSQHVLSTNPVTATLENLVGSGLL